MVKKVVLTLNNQDYAQLLHDILLNQGFDVHIREDELSLLDEISELMPDVIVSSYTLSNLDGETFLKRTREYFVDLPFVFLSSVKDEKIISAMLSYPKCEFMLKPVIPEELIARMRALKDAATGGQHNGVELKVGGLRLDLHAKKAFRNKKEIILTPTEFKLLEYLMTHQGKVMSRDSILNAVWGTKEDVTDRIVDVYIGYLREKIDSDYPKKLIQTTPGFGYMISDK